MFLFCRSASTDSESEKMMNLSDRLDSIISKANCMTEASALKIEGLSGNFFCTVMTLGIVEHIKLSKILESSMYICLSIRWECKIC